MQTEDIGTQPFVGLDLSGGSIWLDDTRLDTLPPEKRGFGMVFQNYALFPHMSVAENLAFPLEVRKMGKAEREEKVMRALDMVQMGKFAHRRPAQMSLSRPARRDTR